MCVRIRYQWIITIMSYVVISAFMILICFPTKSLKVFLARLMILYANAFVFGGLINLIYFNLGLGRMLRKILWGEYKDIFIIVVLAFIIMIFICRVLKVYEHQIVKRNNTYCVTLIHKGKAAEVKALYDTGNCLSEPFTRKPVSICTEGIADILIEGYSEKMKNIMSVSDSGVCLDEKVYVVPFVSVGNDSGLIMAVEISSMKIHTHEKTVEVKKPLIGFYSGKINGDMSYDLILNSAVMNNDIV